MLKIFMYTEVFILLEGYVNKKKSLNIVDRGKNVYIRVVNIVRIYLYINNGK